MDLYDEGTSDNAEAMAVAYDKQSRMGGMGLVEYGPGEVRRMVEAARVLVEATDKDVRNANDSTINDSWVRVIGPWKIFYPQTQGFSGAFNQFRDKTAQRALQYAEASEKIRAALRARKASVTPYHQVAPAPGKGSNYGISLNPSMGVSFPWKWVLVGTGAVVVGYGVYRYVKQAPARALNHREDEG